MQEKSQFYPELQSLIRQVIIEIYQNTTTGPRHEIFGLTSQIRRSAVSIGANQVEGYARMRTKTHKLFIETAYGSLKETIFLLDIAVSLRYISEADAKRMYLKLDRIGSMLWGVLSKLV